ncbi:hypothetical protein Glove_2g16 [Diversispora epigaea]|uniref:F-box domain-containing protein n=1 Tax=Diversispora epigaea TaxID=1348612 RepID=A0A397JPH5_9GLOM|nr:hypothetical protein Glove_2g16 [Diversispora epigaea]
MKKKSKQRRNFRTPISAAIIRHNSDSNFKNNHNENTNKHVSALLDQLRHESRSNDIQNSTFELFPSLPMPASNYLAGEYDALEQRIRGENESLRQLVSGPIPPKSWRGVWYKAADLNLRKIKRGAWDDHSNCQVPTLTSICIDTITLNIRSYKAYKAHTYFSNLPTHLKQYTLSTLSIHDPLTDDLLPLFSNDSKYVELDIAFSDISIESFRNHFWKTIKEKDIEKDIVEDWEDLIEYSDDDVRDILSVQLFKVSRNNETTRKEKDMKNYISKLPDLRRLNCGFTKNIPIIPLATLLVSTLPLLTHLSIAGCSDFETGPHALRIISRLINLLFLDISYCEWISDNILLQFINWGKDLKSLKLLVAVGCINLNDPEGIRKQLGNHRKRFELWTEIKV